MLHLSTDEKDELARWLSGRAKAGSWFMLAMAGFVLLLVLLTIGRLIRAKGSLTADDVIPIVMLILAFAWPGIWLLRRRQAIRRLFDEPMRLGNGRIVGKQRVPYMGWRIRLRIQPERGETILAELGYLGDPNWQVGDDIALIFWEDGRFCPRHLQHITDMGRLPHSASQHRLRRRVVTAVLIFLALALLGVFLGLYGQGRL